MTISNFCRFLLFIGMIGAFHANAQHRSRPNILFIITDDQSPFTLKAYGNHVCQTPNIDAIAAGGITLTGAYHMGSWISAVCLPSRMQIMTGTSVWRTMDLDSRDISTPARANPSLNPEESMPAVFNRAGYITFRTCKQGNSYEKANRLFTYRYDKTCTMADDENGSKWHGDRALEFLDIRASEKQQEPFLMFLGFSHPHDPRHEKEEFYKKYGASDEPPVVPNPKAPPLPINYLPKHPFSYRNVRNLRDETEVQGVMTRRDERTIRNEIGREYACIDNIDVQIGRVLRKLKEMGELENTYIFFTSDHGTSVGRHGLTGKQNLYEHSWRVPLIVKGPGISAGTHAPGNTYLSDILPTMCDIAGIAPPKTCDGESFLPVLQGKTNAIRDVLYGVFYEDWGPGIRSVKAGDWKLIKYDVNNGQLRKTQLFNLSENPNELLLEHQDPAVIRLTGNKPKRKQVDLANNAKYADKLKEMEALLLEQQIKYNDPFRLWDQPAIGK